MKWESGDINVVERASIPKFSKLGDIVTPLRFLELFFDDVLVDMIVGYSKLCNHRERADISFEIANEKIRLFLSMLLFSGCRKPPDCKKILEDNPPILLCGLINKTNSQVEQIHRMNLCYRTHGCRQRINNKPIRDEYKIWIVVTEALVYVVQFRQVQRKENRLPPLLNRD